MPRAATGASAGPRDALPILTNRLPLKAFAPSAGFARATESSGEVRKGDRLSPRLAAGRRSTRTAPPPSVLGGGEDGAHGDEGRLERAPHPGVGQGGVRARGIDAPFRGDHVAVQLAPLAGREAREGATGPAMIVPAPARGAAHLSGACELRMHTREMGESEGAPLDMRQGGKSARRLAPRVGSE